VIGKLFPRAPPTLISFPPSLISWKRFLFAELADFSILGDGEIGYAGTMDLHNVQMHNLECTVFILKLDNALLNR
jgi:hypothetical protein